MSVSIRFLNSGNGKSDEKGDCYNQLLRSIERENLDEVKRLIYEENVSINSVGKNNPLAYAMSFRYRQKRLKILQIANLLIEHEDFGVNDIDCEGKGILFYVMDSQYPEFLQKVLSDKDLNVDLEQRPLEGIICFCQIQHGMLEDLLLHPHIDWEKDQVTQQIMGADEEFFEKDIVQLLQKYTRSSRNGKHRFDGETWEENKILSLIANKTHEVEFLREDEDERILYFRKEMYHSDSRNRVLFGSFNFSVNLYKWMV